MVLARLVALTSCAKLGIGGKTEPANPPSALRSPPASRPNSGQKDRMPARLSLPVETRADPGAPLNLTPEEDIVFTDPDNPDANLPELSTLLTAPKRRGPWEESETIAKQRAAREGKPLLIWFTDSARSPMCKALSQELFSTPEFESWASEKLIRLRVDANVQVNDPESLARRKGNPAGGSQELCRPHEEAIQGARPPIACSCSIPAAR